MRDSRFLVLEYKVNENVGIFVAHGAALRDSELVAYVSPALTCRAFMFRDCGARTRVNQDSSQPLKSWLENNGPDVSLVQMEAAIESLSLRW